MKPLILALIFVSILFGCAQKRLKRDVISLSTHTIVTKIETENQVMSEAIGEGGVRPQQYDNFVELQKKASKEELISLTDHPNAAVRCYSFWALSYDSSANLFPIVLKHLSDTVKVSTQFGCIGGNEKVGDFFINIVTPEYIDMSSQKADSVQLSVLDSFLIYRDNNLNAKDRAIERAGLTERLYKRMKKLVYKENNQSALVTLAKFQRQEDIPLILKNNNGSKSIPDLFYTYRAIREFPDPSFFPLLRKNLLTIMNYVRYSNEWRELYKAIAAYKNRDALELLKIPFTKAEIEDIRPYHIDFIFEAVQTYPSPLYEDILWTMWADEKKISAEIFHQLYQKNSERAYQLTKQTISNADDFYYLAPMGYSSPEEPKEEYLMEIMLDTVISQDRSFAIEQINKHIRNINVHQFPLFAKKAIELKDPSLINSLADRLKTEDNAHIYLEAASALIRLKDKKINQKILAATKINPNLRNDWGGKAFEKLLQENRIR